MTNEAITFEEKNDVAFLKYLSSAVERGQENGEELAARVEEDPVYGVENSASHLKHIMVGQYCSRVLDLYREAKDKLGSTKALQGAVDHMHERLLHELVENYHNPTWTCGYHNAVVNTRRAAVSAVVQRLATHSCRSRLDR